VTFKEAARFYLPATLFAGLALYSAIRQTRMAPGFALVAVGYAIPFTRHQFNARGSELARLGSARLLLTGLGFVYLVASAAGPLDERAFWLIAAAALAILLPGWLWGTRLLAAAGREADEALRPGEER
jgi:hypothetical protein